MLYGNAASPRKLNLLQVLLLNVHGLLDWCQQQTILETWDAVIWLTLVSISFPLFKSPPCDITGLC